MENFWLITISEEQLEQCIKEGVFGLSQKYLLPQINKGDLVMLCASKTWRLYGFGEISRAYYYSEVPIFDGDGTSYCPTTSFPHRVNFRVRELLKTPIEVLDTIKKLSFVENKERWGMYFFRGIRQLPRKDWEVLERRLAVKAN